VKFFEEMKHIYRGERVKKKVASHNYSQKTCKNTFFDLTTIQNVCKTFSLWCRPPAKMVWCSSDYIIRKASWFPDYIIWKNTILGCIYAKLAFFSRVMDGSDFIIWIASALDSFV